MPISRRTTYTANTTIDPDVHNLEHDDYVSGINANTAELVNCVKLTGDQVIAGSKGFSNVPYTTGGDPTTDNSLVRRAYADTKDIGLISGPAPVYQTASTFTVASFHARNSVNDGYITKATSTTVDISTNGLNGCARSNAPLIGTIAFTNGSNVVTGTGSNFIADLQVGDTITGSFGAFRITSISSATSLTVHMNASVNLSGQTYYRGGECGSTWFYLYAVTDGVTPGLILSPRNIASEQGFIDFPYTPSAVLTGTISTTASSPVITGTNTTFQNDYQVGDTVLINGGNQLQIASITSNTSMTATTNATVTVSGATHTRIRARLRQFPFAVRNNSASNILPFVVGEGWPRKPYIGWRDYEAGSFYRVLNGGTQTSWQTISLAEAVPPISKMVELDIANSSTAGSLIGTYVRTTGTGSGGRRVSIAYASYVGNFAIPHVQTDGNQQIDYLVGASNTSAYIDVTGFYVTEVD